MGITKNRYATMLLIFLGVTIILAIPTIFLVNSVVIAIPLSIICGISLTRLYYKLFPNKATKTKPNPVRNKENQIRTRQLMVDPTIWGIWMFILLLIFGCITLPTFFEGTLNMPTLIASITAVTLSILFGTKTVTKPQDINSQTDNELG